MRFPFLFLLALAVTFSPIYAKKKKKANPAPIVLSEEGKALEKQYSEELVALREKIKTSLPNISQEKIATYSQSIENEKAAKVKLAAAQKEFGRIKKGHGLVGHSKNHWIPKAEKGVAKAEDELAKAQTPEEKKAKEAALAKAQKGLEAGHDALKERQALLDEALKDEPVLTKNLNAAQEALKTAQFEALASLKSLGTTELLLQKALDADLTKYVVLLEGTPTGLAAFAQENEENKALITELLNSPTLMFQILVADGPFHPESDDTIGGAYGPAMKIYKSIQSRCKDTHQTGLLQKLALAISLVHAKPVSQRNPVGNVDAPGFVDPISRYEHYKKAHLEGHLDPSFKDFDVWDLKYVVYGSEPDDTLKWGREMLNNYFPAHVSDPDYRWRYVATVKTDVRYGSQDNKFDKPELQFFQNILCNGGICGRRAFFGRFILRAFGIPTTARPQPGHAALTHWTPDGWVVNLGGGWGIGHTKTRYNRDRDFLANTQAREVPEEYLRVKRAQWIGDVLSEKRVFGLERGEPGFWYGISLYTQRDIIERAKAVTLAAVGTDLGEANESKVKEKVKTFSITDTDRVISVDDEGAINIPAAATSRPKNNTAKINFMESNLGGVQLHYRRQGNGNEDFEYTFDVSKGGTYQLTARVVTPSWRQHLYVSANGDQEKVDMALPYTIGMWDTTEPVTVNLKEGKNVLTFSRGHEGLKGISIRDFTLAPL